MNRKAPEIKKRGEISAILLLLATAFILISLVSYEPLDTSLYTSSPHSPPVNKGGKLGAYISGYLLFSPFGLASWFFPVLTLMWGYNRLRGNNTERLSLRILGAVLVLLMSSCGFSLSNFNTEKGYFMSGGIIGEEISRLLLPWFGRWGSYMFIFFLFVTGIVLASEFVFSTWMKSFIKLSSKLARLASLPLRINWQRARPKVKVESNFAHPSPVIRRELHIIKPSRESALGVVSEQKAQRLAAVQEKKVTRGTFQLPPTDLLELPAGIGKGEDFNEKCQKLEEALHSFGVEGKVVEVNEGPVISSFEIEPARGVKISQITSLSDDLALVLKTSRVRIVTPVPGKSAIGIEVPNLKPRFVTLREVLESDEFREVDSKLALGLGKDIVGKPLIADLSEMPHLLVAGTTGSGKTICLNSIILSILFQATPDEVRFLMIDPKRVELAVFENIPHLMTPVVGGIKKAAHALKWVVDEMDRRYRMLAEAGVRNITSYNRLKEVEEKMAHVVVIIDELHDLMIVAQSSVEDAITRLAQLSRAVGIHLVIATQRPSVDVITGVIKANLPYRISFQVSSKVDSRTVLDMNGAEKLIGKGDMLFLPPGKGTPVRAQGSLLTDEEIAKVVSFLKKQAGSQEKLIALDEVEEEKKFVEGAESEFATDDELFDEAVKIVLQAGKASTSMLQRRLSIGYARAARLLDMMEEKNIIGSPRGTKPRTVLEQEKNKE